MAREVDWSIHDKERWPEDTIYCNCGEVYRSHSKGFYEQGGFLMVTRKPCPGCELSEGNAYRVSSDPESVVIRQ